MTEKMFEEYLSTSGFGSAEPKIHETFRVGVETVTENPRGLKIIPTKRVVFRLGGASMDLPPSVARDLGKRIGEFADACEAKE